MRSVTIVLTLITILFDLSNITSAAAIGRLLRKCCCCIDPEQKGKKSPRKPPILIQIKSTKVEITTITSQVLTFVGDTQPSGLMLREASASRYSDFDSSRFAESSNRSTIKKGAIEIELECHNIMDSLSVGDVSECKERFINLTSHSVVEPPSNKYLLIVNLKDTFTYNQTLHPSIASIAGACEECSFVNKRCNDLIMTARASMKGMQITSYRRHLLDFLWGISRYFDIAIYDDHSDDEWNTFHEAISIETYFKQKMKESFKFKFVRKRSVNETKSMESLCCNHGLSQYLHEYKGISIADDIKLKWTKNDSNFNDWIDFIQTKPSNELYTDANRDPYPPDQEIIELKMYLLQSIHQI